MSLLQPIVVAGRGRTDQRKVGDSESRQVRLAVPIAIRRVSQAEPLEVREWVCSPTPPSPNWWWHGQSLRPVGRVPEQWMVEVLVVGVRGRWIGNVVVIGILRSRIGERRAGLELIPARKTRQEGSLTVAAGVEVHLRVGGNSIPGAVVKQPCCPVARDSDGNIHPLNAAVHEKRRRRIAAGWAGADRGRQGRDRRVHADIEIAGVHHPVVVHVRPWCRLPRLDTVACHHHVDRVSSQN